MNFDLPVEIEIDGEKHAIRNKGDYRVLLDVIAALNDIDLEEQLRIKCALFIFYEDISAINNLQAAAEEMMKFINYGESDDDSTPSPQLIDWEKDFKIMAPPINRNLGYDIRFPDKYTHWWTFLGGYMEIGESTLATVVSIRKKRQKGERLEKWEQEFYRDNRKMIDLPIKLTSEEKALLESDW